MKLFVTALNSGSNGNCYYVGNEEEAILIDAGISCKEIERRLSRLNLNIKRIKAVFISHEHADHIKGVESLSKKHHLPVYITSATLSNSCLNPHHPYYVMMKTNSTIKVGNLNIFAFPKFHDANDPHSFIIKYNDLCVGVFTDIGEPCEHLIKHFKCCHAAFLEANYDDKMLSEGNYPYYLKNRIRGGKGHLSNQQALDLFIKYKSDHLSHLFLSHISKENNDPQLVKNLFQPHSKNVNVVLTSRHEEIPIYEIGQPSIKFSQLSLSFQ